MSVPPCPVPVWVDGRNIGRPGGTGIATYAQGLLDSLNAGGIGAACLLDHAPGQPPPPAGGTLRRLARFARALRPGMEVMGDTSPFCPDVYRVAHVRNATWRRLMTLRAPAAPRVMHWTSPLPLRLEGALNITTVHDLIPLTSPALTGIDGPRFRATLERLFRTMDMVVTVSETTRQEILAHFSLPAERVVNLYQLVDIPASLLPAIAQAPPVAEAGCLVVVGRVEARKNIERLIAAHAQSGTQRPLVIIGPDGDDRPDCTAPGRTPVRRVQWCERPSLLRAIRDAHALLLPSLAEGFGLPIVEAMALGTPVLTSRGGATGEVAGGAAMLVDPTDTADIARGIAALDSDDPHDPLRTRLVADGYERAAFFSAAQQGQRFVNFYHSLGLKGEAAP